MKKRILILALIILLLGVAGFIFWAENSLGPMPEAEAAMQSNEEVQVTEAEWIVFQPATGDPSTGLIIYPGGRVDPVSYAPIAQQIASQGYLVIIVPMPLNLAIFGLNRAADVMAAYPEIDHWAIAGHSLGGSMAASFSYSHPQEMDGLVLWASYPANNQDLSGRELAVSSIYASNDGLVSQSDISSSQSRLPADANFVNIEGGNHGQFGWYGEQPGDGVATISRQEQQDQTAAETLSLLESISK